ncbi:uncharacterized protein LOC106877888 [Octopus bimaculoides]|uniref:Thyroglobulin type-1 domain-containing protein n=1 Tax=Octopus bimaculoides TaxID=37653 RepID=A0A0L8GBZ6_OCTBM|nr:uncharacterized protein LOC106877888 [Octopus bimaculoides]|eukprot:XP_014782418.1 PREDICTED: uncharacterized protein LOC106877888 [Octopus bimaculoides]
MKNILFTIVFTALLTLAAGFVYKCDNQDCSSCPSVENCEKTLKCGCCKICVKFIKEDEICISTTKMLLQTHLECATGLLCNPYTKKCTKDHSFLNQLQEKKPSFNNTVICHNDICYCSFKGQILTGYTALHINHLTPLSCNCARHKVNYKKSGLLGKLFLCTKKGSYENIQCSGSSCYCADESGKQVKDKEGFHISEIESYQC